MNASQIDQRVVDFYPSTGSRFFGAVVSTCSSAHGQPGLESAPTLVTLVGNLDVSTAPLLHDCFARIHGDVEVDCSGLDVVDPQGLAVLVAARARCEPQRHFVLLDPATCLSRLLRITGLDATLESTRDAAPVR